MKQVKSKVAALVFLLRNGLLARRIRLVKPVRINGITYRGYRKGDAPHVASVYTDLNRGAEFGWLLRSLYGWRGARLLVVATRQNDSGKDEIVAMNMYYANARDMQEHTIHEGFIGVRPKASGQGIATNMRKIAQSHFAASGFHGISTRISANNAPSLHSALHLGFKSVEILKDPDTNEDRHYMVRQLREFQ